MKALRSSKGFTLIELMIVVAIIGILAAIAIPNFLQYQLKSRQSEVRTNLGAIRTSELSFNGERGCYIALAPFGPVAPAANTKTAAVPWGVGPGTSAVGTVWCVGAGAVFSGLFGDVGFVPTGNVFYRYAADSVNVVIPVPGCLAGNAPSTGANAGAAATGFVSTGASNLDGDGTISVFGTSSDIGSLECTPAGTF